LTKNPLLQVIGIGAGVHVA